MPIVESLLRPITEQVSSITRDIRTIRATGREIQLNEDYARKLEFNPDGSEKNAAQIATDARTRVLAVMAELK